MRLLLLALLTIIVIQGAQNHATQADLQAQFDSANEELVKTGLKASANATKASIAEKATQLEKETNQALARKAEELAKQLAKSDTELDAAKADAKHFEAEATAAKNELTKAKKAALAEAHNTCPPPEVVPEETQQQEYAPGFHRDDGSVRWRTDFDGTNAVAKKMHRLQFIAWGTRSCPHCDVFMRQCSTDEVGRAVFKTYAPCWITVQDRATYNLADKFGVNKFQYPAVVLLDTESGDYRLFRPSKDNDTLLRQLDSERAELEK